MAKTEEDIRKEFAAAFKAKAVTVLAEVKGVDQQKRTCDIDDGGVIMYGIRLQSIAQGNTGMTLFPKVGSQVLCVRIEDSDDYMVVHASEVESAELKIQDKSVTMDQNGFVFNGGTIGAVKADAMVQWMAKVYADIQSLVVTLGSGSTPTGNVVFAKPFTPGTPEPQLTDFADDTIKH